MTRRVVTIPSCVARAHGLEECLQLPIGAVLVLADREVFRVTEGGELDPVFLLGRRSIASNPCAVVTR